MKLKINFSTYEETEVYLNRNPLFETVMSFSLDFSREKLILYLKQNSHTFEQDVSYQFRLFDLKSREVQYSLKLKDRFLITRLMSNMH